MRDYDDAIDDEADDEDFNDNDFDTDALDDTLDDDVDASTIDCPYCSNAVYEDAERCPACGNYLSPEDSDEYQTKQRYFSKQPLWIIITAVVLIYAMLHAYLWPLLIGVQLV